MKNASRSPAADRPFLSEDENPFTFDHVRLRFRHDGWTPERQEHFIEALAATGCVEHAARAVGKSVSSAYALKTRVEAQPFRIAWEAALELGIKRLSEAAISRAIHGVPQPIFYKGEQVGERRHFDERLTMFLLRYRDPARYGPWIDRAESVEEPADAAALQLRKLLNHLMDRLFAEKGEGTAPAKDKDVCANAYDSAQSDEAEDADDPTKGRHAFDPGPIDAAPNGQRQPSGEGAMPSPHDSAASPVPTPAQYHPRIRGI